MTNYHVISEAAEISVTLDDGTKLKAEAIGRDEKTDLALLRIKPNKLLLAVKFGSSEKVKIGGHVVTIFNALGLAVQSQLAWCPGSTGTSVGVPMTTISKRISRSVKVLLVVPCSTLMVSYRYQYG